SSADGFKPPIAFVKSDGTDLGVVVMDVNGDGRADLLQSYQVGSDAPVRSAYTSGQSGWDSANGYVLPFVVSKDGKVVAQLVSGKWTGASGPDLLYQSGDDKGFLKNS